MSATAQAHAGRPVETPAPRVRLIFGALLLVLLMASLDQTIVSTALPTIVGELGGLTHLSWVVTAYLLASTVVSPLYGKLGDLYGRKRVLQVAIVIFLVGSALCGAAQNMPELIAFRGVQGLGGGGLFVTTIAVIGDLVPPRDRGRYQGLFGGVFGISTVAGPLLGGFFVDNLSWRWIFYVNVPLGALALVVISVAFAPHQTRTHRQIDYLGTIVLAVGLSAVVLYTSLGGNTYSWTSAGMLLLLAAGIVSLAAFPFVERRAAEPILPPELFHNRVYAVTSAIGFVVGLSLFGSVTFVPLYLQVVKGHTPTESGLLMTPMMGGLLLTSIVSGLLISHYGRYRVFPILGTAIATVGLFLLSRLGVTTPTATAAGYMLVLGLGIGMVIQVLVLAAQNAVDYRLLGVATSGATLVRQVGGSIGVALFGAIFSHQLRYEIAARLPASAHIPAAANPAIVKQLPPAVHAPYVAAFAAALHPVFLTAAAFSLVSFGLSWLLQDVPMRETVPSAGVGESIPAPREDSSARELERLASATVSPAERGSFYRRTIARAGLDLAPAEAWLLGRLRGRLPATAALLADELRVDAARVGSLAARLERRGLARDGTGAVALTVAGGEALERLLEAGRAELSELCAHWVADEGDEEPRAVLRGLAASLIAEIPADEPARGRG